MHELFSLGHKLIVRRVWEGISSYFKHRITALDVYV